MGRIRPNVSEIGENTAMQVTFYGVRGSTPCCGDDTQRYGGNTSCVGVSVPGEQPLFFDLGTGARYFGTTMPHDGSFRGTCLLSHLHWDHTQGLPFFTVAASRL
jgi:phosphoribosyl 1,2-cyclic phosphodiesterase